MNRLLPLTLACFAASCVVPAWPPTCLAGDDPSGSATNVTELKEHFGEQQFAPQGGFLLKVGQKLPKLVWQHPELVAKVVDDPAIPTRWFNERFEEVQSAEKPGRYYAYGEAPVPSGPPLPRAMTSPNKARSSWLPSWKAIKQAALRESVSGKWRTPRSTSA